jgi:hypothetical protein
MMGAVFAQGEQWIRADFHLHIIARPQEQAA